MKYFALILLSFLLSISLIAQKKIGEWNIKNGILSSPSKSNIAEDYWSTINSVLPKEYLKKYVVSLRLFSDGKDKNLGGMVQMNDSNTEWQIDLDTADLNIYKNDSITTIDRNHTLIHEFGHLLTLNASQIEPTEDEYQDDTRGYLTGEGYALKNSYLGMFVAQFWNEALLTKWDDIDAIRNEKKRVDLLYEFYLSHPTQFITDYAAESPEEDIAESWTFFVIADKPNLKNYLSKKVLFFYQFPELVSLRTEIRSNLKVFPKDYIETFKYYKW